ncbi:hypothetical protein AAC387_Pa10g0637 [Persea americana]
MGSLHEAMERSKLAIQADCRYYKKYWKTIDDRWGRQLKHDLHFAGYFFNPQFTNGHRSDEIRLGLKNVIEKLAENTDEAIWATNQIDIYNIRAGSFRTTTARRAITQTNPAEWWLNYRESAHALRTIAIKGRALDTSQPKGKEVDEESESSIFTSSSSAGIPPDSPGDEGHYRDDEPFTYETIEHFPGATELDPRRGYVRHVGGTEAGSSSGTGLAGQGVGEGTHGHYGGYVGQQGDQHSSSSYQEQSEYGHGYDSAAQQYGAYLFNQYRRNDDDDDDIEPGRHSTWN